MALRSDWSRDHCPIRRSLDQVGDPWTLLIVRDLLHGPRRFDDLRTHLGISETVLARRLRTMAGADLVVKGRLKSVRGTDGQYYECTPKAKDLLPVLQQLALWGGRFTQHPPGGGQMILHHRTCGRDSLTAEVCSACGATLVAKDMTWVKPWSGSRDDLDNNAAPND